MEGWGENPERIEALIRDDVEVLAMWRDAMKQKQGQRTDIVDIVNEVKPSKGNSRSYTVSRLQREAPDPRARGANLLLGKDSLPNLTSTEGHGNLLNRPRRHHRPRRPTER